MRLLVVFLIAILGSFGAGAAFFQGAVNGGGDATTGILPSYNDAYANWRNAGLLSVGGLDAEIAGRTTLCTTAQAGVTLPLSPSGLTPPATGDDAANINQAIANCPANSVIVLGAGTFNLDTPTSEFILLNNSGVTLRGTGTCNTATTITSAASTTVYAGPYYNPYCATLITSNNGLIHNNTSQTCGTSQSATNSCGSGQPMILMTSPGVTNQSNWLWSGCNSNGATWGCNYTVVSVTADAAAGAKTVSVNTTTPFSPGMWVMIDEASGAGWVNDPVSSRSGGQVWAAPDAFNSSGSPITGRVVYAKYSSASGDYASGVYPYQTGSPGCFFSHCDRVTTEIHLITSVDSVGGTITFDDPLTTAFRRSGTVTFNGTIAATTLTTTVDSCTLEVGQLVESASTSGTQVLNGTYVSAITSCSGGVGVYTVTLSQTVSVSQAMQGAAHQAQIYIPTNQNNTPVAFGTYIGIENLSISRGQGDIRIAFCAYCWVKNVDASAMVAGAVEIQSSARIQVDTVFGHDCWNDNSNGSEYPLDFLFGTTESLIVNSMTRACGKGVTARAAGAGDVVAYNYFDDHYYGLGTGSGLAFTLVDASASSSHASTSHHTLFEGNWAVNGLNDDVHGPSNYLTYYRNYANGYRTPFTDVASTTVVDDYAGTCTPTANCYSGTPYGFNGIAPASYTYWTGNVGNTLGNPTYSTSGNGWLYTTGTPTTCNSANSIFNLGNDSRAGGCDAFLDSVSGSYLFRHGNYDTVNGTVIWDSGTPDHTLTNSFYLTVQPSFFGNSGATCSYSWPWVTPTGGSQVTTPTGGGSCGSYSGLPAKARWDAGTPFVQP